MLLFAALLFFILLLPAPAWAYFDPGFGGYLLTSVISWIITGLALMSAAVIYCFRKLISPKLSAFLMPLLSLGSFSLGAFLYYSFHRSFFFLHLQLGAYFNTCFGKFFGTAILVLIALGIILIPALFIYRQKYRRFHGMMLMSALYLVFALLGASLTGALSQISASRSPLLKAQIIDPQRIFKGYDLYNGKLIDDKGRIVKEWSQDYLGTIDKNGDYYGEKRDHQKIPAWGRYTWDGRAIWEKHFLVHHEIYLSPQGTIFTFTQELRDYNGYKVDFDIILELDKNGRELQRYSFWDHLKEYLPYHAEFGIDAAFFPGLPLMCLWQNYFEGTYDYFHINSFALIPPNPLEGKDPAFRPGNWLISIFHGSMVFILDRDSKKILWHAVANDVSGGLQGQHSASMLPDGNILLFDNGVARWASRILIIDPLTLGIKWQYQEKGFFSPIEGYVQALPNGNLLVTESKKGHVFELTLDKKRVWDYDDTTGQDGDIYRMTRYPKEMIDHLLQKGLAP